jgi:hypothetical protein
MVFRVNAELDRGVNQDISCQHVLIGIVSCVSIMIKDLGMGAAEAISLDQSSHKDYRLYVNDPRRVD